jgi:hypothetical protein
VPDANTIYTYYGCNNFETRVFGFDIGDAKSAVQTWMSTYSVSYKCTYSTTANNNICNSYNPGGYYPQVFLIKPDKTFIDIGSYSVSQIKTAMAGATTHTCTTGILDLSEFENAVTVYPSPTHGDFTLDINNTISGNYSMEITNVLGQVVLTDHIEKDAGNFTKAYDLSGFEKGLYLVKLTNSEGTIYKKIMLD